MAIRITCPGCKSSLTLADELRGKKVRCKKCETSIKIPDANGAKRQREEEEADADERQPNSSEDDSDEEDEERPAKKKKKKKAAKGFSPVLIIVPVAVVVLLLVGGVSAFFFTRDARPAAPKENQQAKVEEEVQKPQIFNKIQDGSPTKKGGTGIVSNVRGAVYRTERKSELKQIYLAYQQFDGDYKGANRTKENFLEFVKNFGPIRDAIKEGYYVVNLKARFEGASIVAYERDIDSAGYLCAMGDGDVRYVSEVDWKAALGK